MANSIFANLIIKGVILVYLDDILIHIVGKAVNSSSGTIVRTK